MENPEKRIFKAAVINTDELVKQQSRDVADARMTESKEDRSANWFSRTAKRIWKHNLAQEYYRQKNIIKAKKEILENSNLYAGEKDFDADGASRSFVHDEAMEAIVARFTSEHEEEMLREEERDSKETISGQEINRSLKDLIKRYAGSNMSKESFEEEKKRILSSYDESLASEKSLYADNLFSIAEEVKDAVEHGEKIKDMDFEVELTFGNAKSSLSTEAHHNSFDNAVEKLQNSKVGKFIANEPTAILIAAGAYEGLKTLGIKALRSKVVQWGTFGLGALASGGISAAKESARLNRERAQHMREQAKGMEFKDADMKRRKEMQSNTYEMKSATDILANLEEDFEKIEEGSVSEEELNAIMGRLANLESRIKLNDQRKIDLIYYDKFNKVETDRTAMDLKRAEIKVAIRRGIQDGTLSINTEEDFDTYLASLTEVEKEQLLAGDSGIERKDEIFKKMKKSKVAKAFIKSTLMAGTLGFVAQEIGAAFDPSKDGIVEGAFKHDKAGNATALEHLRRWIAGDSAGRMAEGNLHEVVVGGTHMQLPEGSDLVNNPDGTFNIIRGDEVVAENVPINLDAQGNLSAETQEALAHSDIHGHFGLVGEKTMTEIHEKAEDYIKNHPGETTQIHRELWYDNDTPHPFDKNELRTWWGGEGNTGIDKDGNYVFDVQHMTADGSYHNGLSVDAVSATKAGNLKMLFSLSSDTQHQVFEIPVNPDGTIVIPKDSPVAELMFKNVDGHAVFTGKFAEVAQSMGVAEDHSETVRILGTHVGEGKDFIDETLPAEEPIPKVLIDIPATNDYDVPPVVPIRARRPMEKGSYKKNRTVEDNRPTSISKETKIAQGISYVEMPEDKFKPKRKANPDELTFSAENGFKGKESAVAAGVYYIYGLSASQLSVASARFAEVETHTSPQVFIFENNSENRKAVLKKLAKLEADHPKIKFVYVELPKNIKSISTKDTRVYMNKRLKNIVKENAGSENIDIDFYKGLKKDKGVVAEGSERPMQSITDAEWDRYIDDNEVSDARLRDIARKMKINENLSTKELDIYNEKSDIVERYLRNI